MKYYTRLEKFMRSFNISASAAYWCSLIHEAIPNATKRVSVVSSHGKQYYS